MYGSVFPAKTGRKGVTICGPYSKLVTYCKFRLRQYLQGEGHGYTKSSYTGKALAVKSENKMRD